MNKETSLKSTYSESMFFEIRMTARYLAVTANAAFTGLNFNISFEEYIILNVICCNDGICPIDLSEMLLRDRSNVGKIIANLEKLKYVRVKPGIRNNRTVKRIFAAKAGQKINDEITAKLKPFMESFDSKFNTDEQKRISADMKKCREIIGNIAENEVTK